MNLFLSALIILGFLFIAVLGLIIFGCLYIFGIGVTMALLVFILLLCILYLRKRSKKIMIERISR